MQQNSYPLVVEPSELSDRLHDESLLVVDLSSRNVRSHGHIPGSIHLEYENIVANRPPVGGLLPDDDHLSKTLSWLGLTSSSHVVAYDDEGGGKAGRLLWTLDVLGHEHMSLLNGGIHAWANEGYPLETGLVRPMPTTYTARAGLQGQADKEYILKNLDNADVVFLDTRTPEEYTGTKRFAFRAGHIPGAVNMDWVMAMDLRRNLRLKPEDELREMLAQRGVTPEREVVVYCQTHHRSSHTYVLLKALGFPRVRGYAGAWSEWGNLTDTPVA